MVERRYDHAAADGSDAEAGVTPGEAQRVSSADEVEGAQLPSGAFGKGLPPKRKQHLTVFEKLEQAEAKIRQAHRRAARAAPQRLDEEWGRAPGVSAQEQRAYAVGVLHGLGQAVRYLNEAKP